MTTKESTITGECLHSYFTIVVTCSALVYALGMPALARMASISSCADETKELGQGLETATIDASSTQIAGLTEDLESSSEFNVSEDNTASAHATCGIDWVWRPTQTAKNPDLHQWSVSNGFSTM